MKTGSHDNHACFAVLVLMLAGCAHIDDPIGPIERKYYADGPSPRYGAAGRAVLRR
jgi:hypothetical protein